jgi:excisionase family DNA binding protein
MNDTTTRDSQNEKLMTAQWFGQNYFDPPLPSSTIYDYARRGIIPSVRIGRLVRFRRADVERFIEAGGSK